MNKMVSGPVQNGIGFDLTDAREHAARAAIHGRTSGVEADSHIALTGYRYSTNLLKCMSVNHCFYLQVSQ